MEAAYSSAGTLIENLNLLDAAENCAENLSKKVREGLKDFCLIMKKLQGELDEKSRELPEDFQVALLAEQAVSAESKSDADSDADSGENGAEKRPDKGSERNFERLSVFIQRVIEEAGLDEYHKSQDEIDGTSRVQNLQELVNSAISYPFSRSGLLDFLDSIELDRTLADQAARPML